MGNVYHEISDYMKEHSGHINKKVEEIIREFTVKKTKKTEEDFKYLFTKIIDRVADDIGIRLDPLWEHSVYKGRIDALYNLINLEYKVPTAIEPRNSYPARESINQTYIKQVKKQIEGYSNNNNINKDTVLGIIFDGEYFIYVNYLTTDWYISEPEKRDEHSLTRFFVRLFSLNMENRAVTVQHLEQDFGFNSPVAKNCISTFYDSLVENMDKHGGIRLLFEQWKALFSEVTGYSYDTVKLDINELIQAYGVKIEQEIQIENLIFAIHTYYALMIKLLAVEILYYHRDKDNIIQHTFDYRDKKTTKATLEDIENGGRFEKLGIKNFIEGDFFGWYLSVWNDDLYDAVKNVMEKLDEYNYQTLNLDERNSRDLLKKLYNYLLPRSLRHALGEYYSPDWLAQHTYNQLGINGDINAKVLDPNAGSGTFIVIAIKEVMKENQHLPKKELLRKILSNIHGFDLNPLAVIAARANYIIALGDLIDSTEEDIEIPIYHCDTMLTILEQPKGSHIVRKLATRAGIYEIPNIYIEEKKLFNILKLFNDTIESNKDFDENLWDKITDMIPKLLGIDSTELNEIKDLTIVFYRQIIELEEKGIRKIWTQIIKNAFAPIFHEKVDYIIGNPPWVNWQTLPEDYRDSIHKHWHNYKIFDFKGLQARLGSAHDDISVLLTYVVMDNFLKENGKLGFIINQNLLQAYGGGEGFRKFMIKEQTPVKVLEVHDFVDVEPFFSLGASNKTATIIMQKGQKTNYPVAYKKWSKVTTGTIDSDDLLDSVISKIDWLDLVAIPLKGKDEVTGMNSPWLIAPEEEIYSLQKLVGESEYVGRKGVDTSLNALYWVEILGESRGRIKVRTTPENSKKQVPAYEEIIEKELVYPLVRGRDVKKWHHETPYSIIVPYRSDMKTVITMDELKEEAPLTYTYFYDNENSGLFEELLVNRAIYKKHYKGIVNNTPPHVLYNIGIYTSAPYKVIWKALQQRGMNCCVISKSDDNKMVIPDHNNVLVAIDNEQEAHYLCGVLNSIVVEELVDAYISWFKSTHILESIAIPKYVNSDLQNEIAELSLQAHNISKEIYSGQQKEKNKLILKLQGVEEMINSLVFRLLKEI